MGWWERVVSGERVPGDGMVVVEERRGWRSLLGLRIVSLWVEQVIVFAWDEWDE